MNLGCYVCSTVFWLFFFCGRLWRPIKWCVFVPRDKCRYFHVHKFFLVIFVFNSPRMFIDMWSQLVFGQQFSWTFVTTILIKWVGPNGQTDTFSSSNDPQSGKIELIDFASYSPWIFLWYVILTYFLSKFLVGVLRPY